MYASYAATGSSFNWQTGVLSTIHLEPCEVFAIFEVAKNKLFLKTRP